MSGEIWGAGVGLAIAGLRQKFREMQRLEVDMISMDQPGFTRTVQQSAVYYANGVAVGISDGQIQEVTDAACEGQLRSLSSQVNSAQNLVQYLSQIENAFGHMGGTNALLNSGNKVVTAINTLCSQGGENPTNKQAVLDALQEHLRQISLVSNSVQNIRNSASGDLATQFTAINALLTDIAAVNQAVSSYGTSPSASSISYLRQRRALLDELAQYIEFNVSDTTGSFLVYTPTGSVLVQDSLAAEYFYSPASQIDASQTFGAGTVTLKSIAIDTTSTESPSTGTHISPPGDPNYYDRTNESFIFDVSNEFQSSMGGSATGLIQFLQDDSVIIAQQLDSYAAGLRDSFNAIHNLSSAIAPRSTLLGSSGYIGGSSLLSTLPIDASGVLRIAVVNTSTNVASFSADVDITSAINVTGLCTLINSASNGNFTASINSTTNSLQITTSNTGCGISLGSVSGQLPAMVSLSNLGSTKYGFSEFFHLNDIITAPPQYWRGGSITGISSNLALNSSFVSNPDNFSIRALRNDVAGLGAAQAVSGDASIGRSLSDLFTRTTTSFVTASGGSVAQTLEAFSKGIVQQVGTMVADQKFDLETDTEAFKQQQAIFDEQYGLSEQEIAIQSMQISKSQDLYFSFINNYWRMMSRVAEMGK